MAGLSAAAFLTLGGRSVAVVEMHDKVGGFASSFELGGTRFDLGIEGVRELAPDSFLPQFLRWWGVRLPMDERREILAIHTRKGSYTIRGESAREDLRSAFPASARDLDRFFDPNARIFYEQTKGPPPKSPGEIGLLGKMGHGIASLVERPTLLRHRLRDSSRVLPELFRDPELIRVAASKTVEDMVYLAVAFRWEAFTSGKMMNPRGGMRALPEAIAASIVARTEIISSDSAGLRGYARLGPGMVQQEVSLELASGRTLRFLLVRPEGGQRATMRLRAEGIVDVVAMDGRWHVMTIPSLALAIR